MIKKTIKSGGKIQHFYRPEIASGFKTEESDQHFTAILKNRERTEMNSLQLTFVI